MRLAKLFLRGFGQYEERGNYTILYDGEGILEFGLTEQHIIHDGKDASSKGGCLPEPTTWETRRPVNFHTQEGASGGSIEYLVQLANTVGANPWVCIPHAADDNYVRQFATYLKQHLRPDLKVYVEYSNEVWNGIFRQTQYTGEKGKVMFPSEPGWKAGMKYFNVRASEVASIWNQVNNRCGALKRDRLTNVYAWQTGYQDYYRQALEDLGDRKTNFPGHGHHWLL
ncbi:hypothetical protein C0Q70_17094 [Pomacea canaliculata]|uniref:Uncharacterized protein n=1 Tax=Pomacea canaliculata TaxID=400727 RepID=A0A2T7NRL8_POMCA|nr:hypothetical protein C0Q70_17094 [Pomacea canaliculata]